MNKYLKIVLIAFLTLVGAGCGDTPSQSMEVPVGFVAVPGTWQVRIPEHYRNEVRGTASVLTDGECLIYLSGADNKTLGRTWKHTDETQKLGDHAFNLRFYKDNNNPVRMDAHLLEGDAQLSLDNPAGFVRCETEFKTWIASLQAR